MDRVLGNDIRWGVSKNFSLRAAQSNNLSHEQRLRLKKDGRPCPRIKYARRTNASVYESFSWICGGGNEEGKETFLYHVLVYIHTYVIGFNILENA